MSALLDRAFESQPDLGTTGILLVHQAPAVYLSLKAYLKEYVGFQNVFVAHSNLEAIHLIETESTIQLLAVDCQSSKAESLELLKQLEKNNTRNLGITLITDESMEQAPVKTIGNLKVNHLPTRKPFEFEKLEPVILENLDTLQKQLKSEFRQGFSISDSNTVASDSVLESRINSLEQELRKNTETLNRIQLKESRRGVITFLFRLLLIGLIGLSAWKLGWLEEGWDKLRGKAAAAVSDIQP